MYSERVFSRTLEGKDIRNTLKVCQTFFFFFLVY